MVRDLTASMGSQRQALKMTGLSSGTWHYRHNPRPAVVEPLAQADRDYPSRISQADCEKIGEHILAGWARGESVDHSFAAAWDDGVMLGSRRHWWRVAADLEQELRPTIPQRKHQGRAAKAPVVSATGPNQAWSWDITDLKTPWRGVAFKAYKITDIYSREIVGWRVEQRQCNELAVEMFTEAIDKRGAPQVVHADNGSAMTSNTLKEYLDECGVDLSYNRPYVSNDNPFSEAGFRTMKYRPGYPRVFDTIEAARAYLTDYVAWYNHEHKHSGIALFSPAQVGDGSWTDTWKTRDRALQRYYNRHPERFHTRPRTPTPADLVGINLPNKKTPTK
ncbi:IS3 family transposase [Dietzia sp. SL131]|uniref:IS3 family transposase n=1 Tax=Dietzia sp. SL131 TaxID=2995149 RepID=UPI00227B01E3|nr:IS3 family transposase [Dietzia sp. SL131]MCY1659048.1 IS3 family transposase [Dietzia sp. SL131]